MNQHNRLGGRANRIFDCELCGHSTRNVNPDAAGSDLCDLCYELCGLCNTVSDYGADELSAHDRETIADARPRYALRGDDVLARADKHFASELPGF